ncbi:conserved hypothetical protein [uncultured Desulfobacterium sp.]|uniref:Putative heavy-metal chelation domain-containing protein n=1 Tax=uncultured Desulfobacterium sp. TaxID=201089 RepID=A0A445MQY8_9BACT|nr:conserved hypothetical protein [uncultured Desulfobacterium sp.]
MYDILRKKFSEIIEGRALGLEEVNITARTLTPEEAIGNPEDSDYPIQKGRERLMEADFKGSKGQAFTDMFGNFKGSLSDIIEMELANNFRRAVFVSSINAVMRHLGLVEKTIHCKDTAPITCAQKLINHIKREFGNPMVAMVGLQPRMVEALGKEFELRVTDLDEENIGKQKFGVMIDPPEQTGANIKWCDIALITGSTLVNDTIGEFKTDKPCIFFGVTIAGPARLLGLANFCPCGI